MKAIIVKTEETPTGLMVVASDGHGNKLAINYDRSRPGDWNRKRCAESFVKHASLSPCYLANAIHAGQDIYIVIPIRNTNDDDPNWDVTEEMIRID